MTCLLLWAYPYVIVNRPSMWVWKTLLILCVDCDLLLCQVLFKDGIFQWKRLENLIVLAKENVAKMSSNPALQGKNMSVTFLAVEHDKFLVLDFDFHYF